MDYPTLPAASPTKPFSIDHMLGPSFVSGGQQVFEFVRMMAYSEVGQSGGQHPVGVGTTVETGFLAVRGPITLTHLRFRLTDLAGHVVRGSSLSFMLFLHHV